MTNEPTSDITFEDPPGLPVYDWPGIVAKLESNPMGWARIFERGKTTQAESIRNGFNSVVAPVNGIEVKTRNNERVVDEASGRVTRYCTLYLRYNPSLDTRAKTAPKKRARK